MIGLIAHVEKPEAAPLLRRIVEELDQLGAAFEFESRTANLIGRHSLYDERTLASRCNLLLVLGGDGTILRVIRRIGEHVRPVFGINIGSLGFLTCLGPQEYKRAIECIVRREFVLSERALLAATIVPRRGEVKESLGLNDVVISRGQRSQLVKIRVLIDGIPLTDYYADGLVVSTPTGSTAYSLSAGGPILMPDSGVFVVTPICPHVLSNRSVVVSDASPIDIVVVEGGHEVFVATDGQQNVPMLPGDTLKIRKSPHTLPLAMLPERSFSEVLRQKLKWSGSYV